MILFSLAIATVPFILTQQVPPWSSTLDRLGGRWELVSAIPSSEQMPKLGGAMAYLGEDPSAGPQLLIGVPDGGTQTQWSTSGTSSILLASTGALYVVNALDGQLALKRTGFYEGHLGVAVGVMRIGRDGAEKRMFALAEGRNRYDLPNPNPPPESNWPEGWPGSLFWPYESFPVGPFESSVRVYDLAGGPQWWAFHEGSGDDASYSSKYAWNNRAQCGAVAGDFDGDEVEDLILGVPGVPDSVHGIDPIRGHVDVLSGADGSTLASVESSWAFGSGVFGVGDLNGDQLPDVAVTEFDQRLEQGAPVSQAQADRVWLLSGPDLEQLDLLDAPGGANTGFGACVCNAGDLNEDGFPDLIVSAPFEDTQDIQDAGVVRAYSGLTRELLWKSAGSNGGRTFGLTLSSIEDMNADGAREILVGEPLEGARSYGALHVLSGRDGEPLSSIRGESDSGRLGSALAMMGNLGSDGFSQVAIGSAGYGMGATEHRGAVFVARRDPYLRASRETLSVSSGQSATLYLNFPDTEADRKYAVLMSAAGSGPVEIDGTWIPLTQDALFTAFENNNPPAWVDAVLPDRIGQLNGQGNASVNFVNAPELASQVGKTFYIAVVSLTPPPGPKPRRSSMVRTITIEP